jgi:propanol-preferring alcohol dehydrogenase
VRRHNHVQCYASQRRRTWRFGRGSRSRSSGHLGIQFGNKFGYTVGAIGQGPENAQLAAKLGASRYLSSQALNAAEKLTKMGGPRVILTTAPNAKSMSALINGLGKPGTMMVVGTTPEPIEVSPIQLVQGRKSIQGWPSDTPKDSETR